MQINTVNLIINRDLCARLDNELYGKHRANPNQMAMAKAGLYQTELMQLIATLIPDYPMARITGGLVHLFDWAWRLQSDGSKNGAKHAQAAQAARA